MKKISVLLISLILLTGCGKSCKCDDKSIDKEIGIVDTKVMEKYKIPEFFIKVSGLKDISIDNNFVKDLNVYEIKAVYDNYYNKEEKKFIGIKVKDIMEKVIDKEYYVLFVNDNERLTIGYEKPIIDDNLYLIFNKDKTLSVARFNYPVRNWVTNAFSFELSETLR